MRFFVKAIATGFAMSMGSAIFKKVSDKMGLDSEEAKQDEAATSETKSSDETEDPSDEATP